MNGCNQSFHYYCQYTHPYSCTEGMGICSPFQQFLDFMLNLFQTRTLLGTLTFWTPTFYFLKTEDYSLSSTCFIYGSDLILLLLDHSPHLYAGLSSRSIWGNLVFVFSSNLGELVSLSDSMLGEYIERFHDIPINERNAESFEQEAMFYSVLLHQPQGAYVTTPNGWLEWDQMIYGIQDTKNMRCSSMEL